MTMCTRELLSMTMCRREITENGNEYKGDN